jgi:hypothetical protein
MSVAGINLWRTLKWRPFCKLEVHILSLQREAAMKSILVMLLMFFGTTTIGCTGNVQTTDDSVKVEGEVPKVEVGNAPVDLDPSTDKDIDIDTPVPGDK